MDDKTQILNKAQTILTQKKKQTLAHFPCSMPMLCSLLFKPYVDHIGEKFKMPLFSGWAIKPNANILVVLCTILGTWVHNLGSCLECKITTLALQQWLAMHVFVMMGHRWACSRRQLWFFYIPESFNEQRHQVTRSLPCVGCHTPAHPPIQCPSNLAL